MLSQQDYHQLKTETLQYFWSYNTFRDNQEEVIDAVIAGKDILALLPTGGGKSLCYQLPALLLEGTAIVVSPLLALIRDQVKQLKSRGIEAEYLSSELEDAEAEKIISRCKEGLTKLLYVSPERLHNRFFLQNLEEIQVSFLAVDEAHCISEWGADFRPSYQNIKKFRERMPGVPCLALTATATPKVLEEINAKLGLSKTNVFRKSFLRNNISINVLEISDKYQWISDFLRQNNSSGIIYARTRKETENIADFLSRKNIPNVDFFHAGLSAKEKNERQEKWLKSKEHVLVSTNAFGMGIDKSDVRFIIHFSPPASIENYYQEIGRAGRDGENAYAALLWSQEELTNIDRLFASQIPNRNEFIQIADFLYSIFQVAEGDLPEETFQFNINRLWNLTKIIPSKIRNVLGFLHNQEIINHRDIKTSSAIKLKIDHSEIELLPQKDAYFLEILLRRLPGIATDKVHFSEEKFAGDMQFDFQNLKERLKEMHSRDYIDYLDGHLASVKFLVPRNSRALKGVLWPLFLQIQKNKLQKWEEMKFFIKDSDYCKMQLILSYFGEKKAKPCGICYVCNRKNGNGFSTKIPAEILKILSFHPASAEEIAFKMPLVPREKILENIILLLDAGKVKMLDFRTYCIA